MAAGDIKPVYGSSTALTVTLASLATNSGLLTGRESTVVDNTSPLYLDVQLAGKITTGTSPTADKVIEVWGYGSLNDTPDYPDTLTGLDAGVTITSDSLKYNNLVLLASIQTSATSNFGYTFRLRSLSAKFGGTLPKKWGVFVTHSTGVNLHATGGNHAIWYTPSYLNVAQA